MQDLMSSFKLLDEKRLMNRINFDKEMPDMVKQNRGKDE